MHSRYVAIWFPYLVTDWMTRQKPELSGMPFILYASERGRMIVKTASPAAHNKGIFPDMVVADCRAIFPEITVLEYPTGKAEELLQNIALWCIRFTPLAAVDFPDGVVLDCSGCTHLLNGDEAYVIHILRRLEARGYHARAVMTDTIAASWALSRFGNREIVIPPGEQVAAIQDLPPAALRVGGTIIERLHKLGLNTIGHFANMQRPALQKRFGVTLLQRLDQVSGLEPELMQPVQLPKQYEERLHCLEPISTVKGIEIAIERLLAQLCQLLESEGKGLRNASLRCHRLDGDIQQVTIGTNLPTRNAPHLMKLFELRISQLQPDLGFELFELQALTVEPIEFDQISIWDEKDPHDIAEVAELLDKIISKQGPKAVRRYFPAQHYWPERSFQKTESIETIRDTEWRTDLPRPIHVLNRPHVIEVSVPIPDYPPMLFFYQGKRHQVMKADGPERIEQEWWLQKGEFRDYYCIEDEQGQRYWVFRSGHFDGSRPRWYIHGFFA